MSFARMGSGLVSFGETDQAVRLVCDWTDRGYSQRVNFYTFTLLLTALSKRPSAEQIEEVRQRLVKVEPDFLLVRVNVTEALLKAYLNSDQHDRAMGVLTALRGRGVSPSLEITRELMKMAMRRGRVDLARSIAEDAMRK